MLDLVDVRRRGPAEGRQSLFSWAEVLAGDPAQTRGRSGKLKPSSLSLLEGALVAEHGEGTGRRG